MDKGRTQEKDKPFMVVFVCTANICRSPMAEGILKHLVASDEFKGNLKIVSAGVAAIEGHKASGLAEEICLDAGINISKHASQPVTKRLLKKADLVFAMTPDHRRELEKLYPEYREKIFLLREYGRKKWPSKSNAIDDPYGGTKEAYEVCFIRLQRELKRILPVMKREMNSERRA